MSAIGYVTKHEDGSYKGNLRTLSINAPIELTPVRDRAKDSHPHYRVFSGGVEIGAGWVRTGQQSGKDYVSLSFATPEFGPRKLYANLGPAAGQDDPDLYAVIWNPAD